MLSLNLGEILFCQYLLAFVVICEVLVGDYSNHFQSLNHIEIFLQKKKEMFSVLSIVSKPLFWEKKTFVELISCQNKQNMF